jgi:hypothetical protein
VTPDLQQNILNGGMTLSDLVTDEDVIAAENVAKFQAGKYY